MRLIFDYKPIMNENSLANLCQYETQIDEMVYMLYELTDEEIAIIDGKE
jgi:hypothetical protein